MPRRACLGVAGVRWHIIQRRNNRAVCFHTKEVSSVREQYAVIPVRPHWHFAIGITGLAGEQVSAAATVNIEAAIERYHYFKACAA